MLQMTIPRNNINAGWIIRRKVYIWFVSKSFTGHWLSAKLGCVSIYIYVYVCVRTKMSVQHSLPWWNKQRKCPRLGTLTRLVIWHATINYMHKSYVMLRSSFYVTFHKSQGLPQPLTSPFHQHLPDQLSAESVNLCGKKRSSNFLEQKFPSEATKDCAIRVDPLS